MHYNMKASNMCTQEADITSEAHPEISKDLKGIIFSFLNTQT